MSTKIQQNPIIRDNICFSLNGNFHYHFLLFYFCHALMLALRKPILSVFYEWVHLLYSSPGDPLAITPKRGAPGETRWLFTPKRGAPGETRWLFTPKRGAPGETRWLFTPKRGAPGETRWLFTPKRSPLHQPEFRGENYRACECDCPPPQTIDRLYTFNQHFHLLRGLFECCDFASLVFMCLFSQKGLFQII